jgi:VIT1/CCC1 family predicted Fe2+/Mn2+ transporter
MKESFKLGFSFGITSGIITTLGLIVGLDAGTHSVLAVLGGILTIAVADAFSDSLGMHISQEARDHHKPKDIWESMLSTFMAKFFVALSFAIPFLLIELSKAMIVSVAWGLALLSTLSYFIAKNANNKPWKVVGEHLLIAIVVIAIAYFFGEWIYITFSP